MDFSDQRLLIAAGIILIVGAIIGGDSRFGLGT